LPVYRLYFLGPKGRIEAVTEIVEESDGPAIEAAEALRQGRTGELWDGGRLVKSFDSHGEDA